METSLDDVFIADCYEFSSIGSNLLNQRSNNTLRKETEKNGRDFNRYAILKVQMSDEN